jgi:hypothetical protein
MMKKADAAHVVNQRKKRKMRHIGILIILRINILDKNKKKLSKTWMIKKGNYQIKVKIF